MTFADIAWKNARKKFGGTLVSFFSMCFSVFIFYLFCAMYYNPAFAVYRFGTGKMNALFRASAVAVLLLAAVFVMYSGSYFIKAQKKELAIYSLLGMRKGQIAGMLFLETFFIGMAAVACGTLAGISASGFFAGLLARFMALGTDVRIVAQPRAAMITLLAFCGLFGASGVRAYRTVYRYQLTDLLSATRQTEGIPAYSRRCAWFSLGLLLAGYTASALIDLNRLGSILLLPVLGIVLCVAAGTYLLFRNLVPMAVALLKRKRRLYYRINTFIGISQIAFRLKANARMLAAAALLAAVTITMVSASYSLYRGLEDSVLFYAPYSFLAKDIADEQHQSMLKAISNAGEVTLTADDEIPLCNVTIQSAEYALQNDGTAAPEFGAAAAAYLLSESVYRNVITHTHTPAGEYASTKSSFSGGLGDGECYFLDGNMFDTYCKKLVGKPLTVTMNGSAARYTVAGAGLHKYIGLADLYRHPTVVVNDRVFQAYADRVGSAGLTVFRGFMFDDAMASANTVAALEGIVPPRFSHGGMPGNISYIGMYRANFALYGSYVFIGLFLGVLFLLAVGSVLYYKLVMEAQEEAPRYQILRKAGMTRQEILRSVAMQLGIVYGASLAVGLVHTVFALLTYRRMMVEIGQETPVFQNALAVAALFVAAYGAFYALSVKSYFGIVWKRAREA